MIRKGKSHQSLVFTDLGNFGEGPLSRYGSDALHGNRVPGDHAHVRAQYLVVSLANRIDMPDPS